MICLSGASIKFPLNILMHFLRIERFDRSHACEIERTYLLSIEIHQSFASQTAISKITRFYFLLVLN